MFNHDSPYDDRTPDLIVRVRKLREAAEQKMNAFGNPAEYDVRKVVGRKSQPSQPQPTEAAVVPPQPSSVNTQKSATQPPSEKQKTPQPVMEFPSQTKLFDDMEGA